MPQKKRGGGTPTSAAGWRDTQTLAVHDAAHGVTEAREHVHAIGTHTAGIQASTNRHARDVGDHSRGIAQHLLHLIDGLQGVGRSMDEAIAAAEAARDLEAAA